MKKEKQLNTENKNTFAELLRHFEMSARNRHTDPQTFETALHELSQAIAFSVLKKIESASGNKTIGNMRKSLFKDLAELKSLMYCMDNGTEMFTDKDGERKQRIINKALFEDGNKLISNTLSDGVDLVQECALKLWEIIQSPECDESATAFMELPHDVRKLKGKIKIHSSNKELEWETKQVSYIQESYQTVRRCIYNSSAEQYSNKYIYLKDIATDNETGVCEEYYHRFTSNMYGYADEFGMYETDIEKGYELNDLLTLVINKGSLTPRQVEILHARLCNTENGYKAIAQKLNVTHNTVLTQCKRMQEKIKQIDELKPLLDKLLK